METAKKIGCRGEDRAIEFLKNSGYEIIARQWRKRSGEIDIIGRKSETVVFFEVKTLPHGNLDIVETALNEKKRKRIVETAKSFLQNNRKYSDSIIRFDVLLIDVPGFPEIYQIENAFSEII